MTKGVHPEFGWSDIPAFVPAPSAYIVDVDGTVALRGDRDPYDMTRVSEDTPCWPVIDVVRNLHSAGHAIVFVSARFEAARRDTTEWLDRHVALSSHELYMRPDGDRRPDQVVKVELYTRLIEPQYRIMAVFDDRARVVAAWRDLGLTVFQVADGDF